MSEVKAQIDTNPSQEEAKAVVDIIMERYTDKTGLLLNTLNDIQDLYKYLPKETLQRVFENIGTSHEDLNSMGDFFDNLSLVPTGRYVIEVCDGTCCHIQGAPQIIDRFEKELGIKSGEVTADGLLSLRPVSCVGACGVAPVVQSGDHVYGCVRLIDISAIITSIREYAKTKDDPELSAMLTILAERGFTHDA